MKLSVVIPAYNDAGHIESVVRGLYRRLVAEHIEHELIAVYDRSTDRTGDLLDMLTREIPTLQYVAKTPPKGYGLALQKGLEVFTGDAVAFYTADASDSPEDLVQFFRTMERERVDCVFGSRFVPGGAVIDYPFAKYILNRAGNAFIKTLFGLRYNDVTNGFKLYHRRVIEGARPFLSQYFNFTVELPLKAIVRGYSFAVVPNSWRGRKIGKSKFAVFKMGPLYFLTILYCFIEKILLRRRGK